MPEMLYNNKNCLVTTVYFLFFASEWLNRQRANPLSTFKWLMITSLAPTLPISTLGAGPEKRRCAKLKVSPLTSICSNKIIFLKSPSSLAQISRLTRNVPSGRALMIILKCWPGRSPLKRWLCSSPHWPLESRVLKMVRFAKKRVFMCSTTCWTEKRSTENLKKIIIRNVKVISK